MPNGEKRSALRAQIVSQIKQAYDHKVTADRLINAKDLDEYVQVLLPRGDFARDGLDSVIRSELTIIISKTDVVTDDELDAMGDTVEQALMSDESLGGNARGIVLDSYEYQPAAEDQFSSLVLSYTVIHE